MFVRVHDRRQLIALDGLDLGGAVREVFESAVTMGRLALEAVGVHPEEVDRVEAEYRRRDEVRLEMQSKAGDLHAAKEMMFHPDRPMEDRGAD